MSYWRWLLFAAMARLELREDVYLRIPNAKTIPLDVSVEVHPERKESWDRTAAAPHGAQAPIQYRMKQLVCDYRSVLVRIVPWLRRIDGKQ
jgi:hypothetical protein